MGSSSQKGSRQRRSSRGSGSGSGGSRSSTNGNGSKKNNANKNDENSSSSSSDSNNNSAMHYRRYNSCVDFSFLPESTNAHRLVKLNAIFERAADKRTGGIREDRLKRILPPSGGMGQGDKYGYLARKRKRDKGSSSGSTSSNSSSGKEEIRIVSRGPFLAMFSQETASFLNTLATNEKTDRERKLKRATSQQGLRRNKAKSPASGNSGRRQKHANGEEKKKSKSSKNQPQPQQKQSKPDSGDVSNDRSQPQTQHQPQQRLSVDTSAASQGHHRERANTAPFESRTFFDSGEEGDSSPEKASLASDDQSLSPSSCASVLSQEGESQILAQDPLVSIGRQQQRTPSSICRSSEGEGTDTFQSTKGSFSTSAPQEADSDVDAEVTKSTRTKKSNLSSTSNSPNRTENSPQVAEGRNTSPSGLHSSNQGSQSRCDSNDQQQRSSSQKENWYPQTNVNNVGQSLNVNPDSLTNNLVATKQQQQQSLPVCPDRKSSLDDGSESVPGESGGHYWSVPPHVVEAELLHEEEAGATTHHPHLKHALTHPFPPEVVLGGQPNHYADGGGVGIRSGCHPSGKKIDEGIHERPHLLSSAHIDGDVESTWTLSSYSVSDSEGEDGRGAGATLHGVCGGVSKASSVWDGSATNDVYPYQQLQNSQDALAAAPVMMFGRQEGQFIVPQAIPDTSNVARGGAIVSGTFEGPQKSDAGKNVEEDENCFFLSVAASFFKKTFPALFRPNSIDDIDVSVVPTLVQTHSDWSGASKRDSPPRQIHQPPSCPPTCVGTSAADADALASKNLSDGMGRRGSVGSTAKRKKARRKTRAASRDDKNVGRPNDSPFGERRSRRRSSSQGNGGAVQSEFLLRKENGSRRRTKSTNSGFGSFGPAMPSDSNGMEEMSQRANGVRRENSFRGHAQTSYHNRHHQESPFSSDAYISKTSLVR